LLTAYSSGGCPLKLIEQKAEKRAPTASFCYFVIIPFPGIKKKSLFDIFKYINTINIKPILKLTKSNYISGAGPL